MTPIDVPVLRGSLVRLEPLCQRHVPDLMLAAEEDRSAYAYTLVPRARDTAEYVADQLARDGLTPFAQVRLRDQAAVGCTSFFNPRMWPGSEELYAIEIGFTWLAASAQRTGINAEAKLLLLMYAFETLRVARADLKTDARNQRSRRAIEGRMADSQILAVRSDQASGTSPGQARGSRAILAVMSIGGTLAEARHEAGLTVADVSARTRIRAALIRDIEQDKFASCGGDFYARGHIRAIAGAVGTDPRPLISEYDAAYCPGGPVPRPAVPSAPRATRTVQPVRAFQAEQPVQAGLDDLLTPSPPPPAQPPETPYAPDKPGRPPGRSRQGWLVPVLMLAVIVGVVTLAYRLTDGRGGSQPPAASSSHRASARTATASPKKTPQKTRGSSTATPPSTTNSFPVTQVTPVSAAAFGPTGTSDGDNSQDASLALSGNPATPWHTNWYTTARFGNLQEGTGLLVDLGRTVMATGVTIHLGSTPGANLQVRAGTSPTGLRTLARASNAGGAVRLSLASHPQVRYVLIWFTLLPPDSAGTYQAFISGVTVTASAR